MESIEQMELAAFDALQSRYDAREAYLNRPTTGRCDTCGNVCTERFLTRQFEPKGFMDICPSCCEILGIESIADWPDSLEWCRWDRFPWRSQDYR